MIYLHIIHCNACGQAPTAIWSVMIPLCIPFQGMSMVLEKSTTYDNGVILTN